MNEITELKTRFLPINNIPGKNICLLGYIEHLDSGCLYSISYKTNIDIDFVSLGIFASYSFCLPLDPMATSVQVKIVAKRAPDPDIEFISKEYTIVGASSVVSIFGRITHMDGYGVSAFNVRYRLRPEAADFEAFGSIITPNTSGNFTTDENGFFEVLLVANQGSDANKRIAFPGTYYEFVIGEKIYCRTIDFDDGIMQDFFTLKEPEITRIRREKFYDMRHC